MKKNDNKIILFNDKQVCHHWDDEKELWFFLYIKKQINTAFLFVYLNYTN